MGTKVVAPSGGATSADKIVGGQLSWDVLPFTQAEYNNKGKGYVEFDSGITTGPDLESRGLVTIAKSGEQNGPYYSKTRKNISVPSQVTLANARLQCIRWGSFVVAVFGGEINYVPPSSASEIDVYMSGSKTKWANIARYYKLSLTFKWPQGFRPFGLMKEAPLSYLWPGSVSDSFLTNSSTPVWDYPVDNSSSPSSFGDNAVYVRNADMVSTPHTGPNVLTPVDISSMNITGTSQNRTLLDYLMNPLGASPITDGTPWNSKTYELCSFAQPEMYTKSSSYTTVETARKNAGIFNYRQGKSWLFFYTTADDMPA